MRFPPCVREYLKFRGGKFGKSRGAFGEVPYFLERYDPDALRFYLTATLPGTRDTEACPERSRRILLGGFRRVEQPCPERSQAVQASAKSELPPGQALREPAPLFKKLDESVIEEEYARLEG